MPETPSPHPSTPPTVVIIDDDFISGACLEAMLRQEGFACSRVESGPSGRDLVARTRPDLVLLDVMMPGEDGLETCRKLKRDPAVCDIPVVFLTGNGDAGTRLAGFEAGAADYLTKPFEAPEVLARIRVHIRARRATRLLAGGDLPGSEAPDPELPIAVSGPVTGAQDRSRVLYAGEGLFDLVAARLEGPTDLMPPGAAILDRLLRQGSKILTPPAETLGLLHHTLASALQGQVRLSISWVRLNRRRMTLWAHGCAVVLVPAGARPVTVVHAPQALLGQEAFPSLPALHRATAEGDRLLLAAGWPAPLGQAPLEALAMPLGQGSLDEGMEEVRRTHAAAGGEAHLMAAQV